MIDEGHYAKLGDMRQGEREREAAHFADGERRFHAMVSRYFARS